jgi:hypothetical protein
MLYAMYRKCPGEQNFRHRKKIIAQGWQWGVYLKGNKNILKLTVVMAYTAL